MTKRSKTELAKRSSVEFRRDNGFDNLTEDDITPEAWQLAMIENNVRAEPEDMEMALREQVEQLSAALDVLWADRYELVGTLELYLNSLDARLATVEGYMGLRSKDLGAVAESVLNEERAEDNAQEESEEGTTHSANYQFSNHEK